MSREIKFRAWDGQTMRRSDEYAGPAFGNGSLPAFFQDNWNCRLMQFTGLHDKNGKEIYEGDILSVGGWCNGRSGGAPAAVEFGYLFDSDGYNATQYLCWRTGNSSLVDTAPLSEVIGNIHESRELLEAP